MNGSRVDDFVGFCAGGGLVMGCGRFAVSKRGLLVMRFFLFVFSGLGLLVNSSAALSGKPAHGMTIAQDCEAPCAGYEISTELQNDWIFAADPSSLRSEFLQPTISADYFLAPADFLIFVASITTESVVDPVPGENAIFQGIGSYAEELYMVLDADPVIIRAGKFDTIFSLASEVNFGVNAADLVSNIDADERWGTEAIVGFETLGINQTIAATLFTTDRTFWSESIFTNRGKTRLSDGGAGNTEGISSFSIAVNGCKGAEPLDCYEDGVFGYRLGFRFQRAGHASADQIEEDIKPISEIGQMAAVTAKFEVEDMTIRLLGEADYMRHFEGNPDDALILTGSAALEYGPMTYTAAYSRQKTYVQGDVDTIERLLEVSAVYQSEDDVPFDGASWSLGAAYDYGRDAEAQVAHALSLLFTFTFGGSVEFDK